jgi:hypothetical protein
MHVPQTRRMRRVTNRRMRRLDDTQLLESMRDEEPQLTALNRSATVAQSTTFHHASR